MTEEHMKEYIVKGGTPFIIKTIDTIRDGGTKVLETTVGKFYIHKYSKKFHFGYTPSEENLITDLLTIEYLIERIETYIKRSEEDIERNKSILLEIKNKK